MSDGLMTPALVGAEPTAAQVVWVVLLACAAVALWWWLFRYAKKEQVPAQTWCFFLYCVGAVAVVMAFLPDPDIERMDLGLPAEVFCLLLGSGFILAGAVWHLVLLLRGRGRPEQPGRLVLLLLAVAVFAVVMQSLRRGGLGHWLAYAMLGALALLFVLIGLFVLGFVLRLLPWKSRVNRMAGLIQAQKYEEAIRLGESLLSAKRPPDDVLVVIEANLATAYQLAGQEARAKTLFERLKARPNLPEPIAAMVDERLANQPDGGDEEEAPKPGA
jgi:hypothetical protein